MKKTAYILLAALGVSSCNYLEIEPVGQVIPHKTSEYRALLTEGYFRFPYTDSKAYTGLLSDEVGLFYEGGLFSAADARALVNNYTWQYGSNMNEYPYQSYYRAIFQANAVIDGVPTAEIDSSEGRNQIQGEAYALRAYAHFDLVNLYGKPYNAQTAATDRGVPLASYIDIEQRYRPASVQAVYDLVLDDLEKAIELMDLESQTDPAINYRFSRNGAKAFKARVNLYMARWQEAYELAKEVMPVYELVDFNGMIDNEGNLVAPVKESLPWAGTSPEAIMALERPFSGASRDLVKSCVVADPLLNLIDEQTDLRRNYLTDVGYFDMNTFETVVLGTGVDRGGNDRTSIRVAEMYLIAAEAGAHLPGELSNAKEFLLSLQAKRFKTDAMATQRVKIEAMTAEQLLAEIADERAREFLLEGHRWMDLRRTTRPQIVKTHNGSTYSLNVGDSRYTLPFPQSAIENNPDLNE